MTQERCAAAGCGRWTRAGAQFCAQHAADAADTVWDALAGEADEPAARFQALLAAGDYDALLGDGLRAALRGAAADTGLEAEIGALRLTLARLLQEEPDPAKLAASVARVAAVAVQAARLRQGSGDAGDDLRAAFQRELDEESAAFGSVGDRLTPSAGGGG